ncbi:MAG: hypothetical protein KF819_32865 [Labilithrix sp.]|nr:hypothetical protein [Labilithrix sp.]
MRNRTVLTAVLAALVLAPVAGCAGEAEEAPENVASTEQALSFPSFTPPKVEIPKPDTSGLQLAVERGTALGRNGVAGVDGFTWLVLAPNGEKPFVFRAANDAVKAVADGFEVKGELVLDTPSGPMSFGSAEASFEWGPDKSIGFAKVKGLVDLPFPGAGALQGVALSSIVRGQIGYDAGANLTAIDAPLAQDRHYLYVDVAAGLEAKSGIVTFTAPGGKSLRVVLDPTDPSLFFTGSVLGMDQLGKIENVAVGVSTRGLIPFQPEVTWGIENQVKAMTGHLYLAGEVPLSKYPMSIDGKIVVNVDPDDTGKPAFSNGGSGISLAANGTVNVKVDFIPTIDISFPVVKATMGGKITAAEQYGYFSGEADSDIRWIPTVIPLRPAGKVKIAGLLHSNIDKSFLKAEGGYYLAPTMMNDVLGLNLQEIELAQAKMQIDKTGFRVQGTAATPLHHALAPQGNVAVDAFFSGKPSSWYATMNGNFTIAGFPLASASATASPSGLVVGGSYKTPLSSVNMNGKITNAGPSLSGTASVTIPVVAPKTFTVVKQHVSCGTNMVKSAALCGSDIGESAAECGTKKVTDGAKCGWDVVSSATKCLGCIVGKCSCKVPKSCDIPKSCPIAKTCPQLKSCPVPETTPAFAFGEFRGTVTVAVGPSGASASLSGQFCSNETNTCFALPSAGATLGASPKACVSGVPGASGTFCASF